ncbi:hypothetical protein HYV71_01150 [Candidatus Uhrbacteria bacterium]|nr:hypothetical protein [Candidatus Uhrbacteria bacterium]
MKQEKHYINREEGKTFRPQKQTETIAAMRQKFQDEKNKKMFEDLRGGESIETLLSSAQNFVRELIARYPHVNEHGGLDYYFSGSLALMLLACVDSFESLDPEKIPDTIIVKDTKQLSPHFKALLLGLVRKVGDIDYVRLTKDRQVFGKGGGALQADDFSYQSKKIIKQRDDGSLPIMYDPFSAPQKAHVARIAIRGSETYIPEPAMIIAHKAAHLGQHFDREDKTRRFAAEFSTFLTVLSDLYSREELVRLTHDELLQCGVNDEVIPYYNPHFHGDVKRFFDDVVSSDSDAHLLESLEYGKERSISILKILHRFTDLQSKKYVIDFINHNRAVIDQWRVEMSSQKNRELYADFLIRHPDVLERYRQDYHSHPIRDDHLREDIIENLKATVWDSGSVYSEVPEDIQRRFHKIPQRSDILDLLAQLPPEQERLDSILARITDLISSIDDRHIWTLKEIVLHAYFSSAEQREHILQGIHEARAKLNDDEFDPFMRALYLALQRSEFNEVKNKWHDIEDEEYPERIAGVFQQFEIQYT